MRLRVVFEPGVGAPKRRVIVEVPPLGTILDMMNYLAETVPDLHTLTPEAFHVELGPGWLIPASQAASVVRDDEIVFVRNDSIGEAVVEEEISVSAAPVKGSSRRKGKRPRDTSVTFEEYSCPMCSAKRRGLSGLNNMVTHLRLVHNLTTGEAKEMLHVPTSGREKSEEPESLENPENPESPVHLAESVHLAEPESPVHLAESVHLAEPESPEKRKKSKKSKTYGDTREEVIEGERGVLIASCSLCGTQERGKSARKRVRRHLIDVHKKSREEIERDHLVITERAAIVVE